MAKDEGARVVFNVGQIVNPVAEPTTVTLNKQLQRRAALTGGMVD